MIVGFWAVGFGIPGVSTEFSVFADRTNTTFAMPITLTFLNDKQSTVFVFDDELTAFERKSYDAEALLTGVSDTFGFFMVSDTNFTSSVLSGAVVIGLDPGGSVDGKANLLLDASGNVISTARALTAHTMEHNARKLEDVPLGLTTVSGVSTPAPGFQTFLVLLNAGTLTTVGTTTPLDQTQPVALEFFGDNEVFIGSCDIILTAFDVWISRIGLTPKLNDLCVPLNFKKALVAPANTMARWAASIRAHNNNNNVLVGEVFTINTKSLEAYSYPMSYAHCTTTLHETELTRLLVTD
ncbi:MAG: hypothetical protein HY278_06685 [candidate division NC10 bacterium]|nr:hypothetical protein [candidate division NC10 bacterium]